ncbi:GlcG/HbpS family heme-binding protein [Halomonas sp. GT]|uniref:GlcG/HbpS family heme-binding protein n=1 Tax=Halomonas sp. GT TaxID=1971364 RepID=UPI0009F3773C|nr:heme-binding protein [Halomonas sp. GT]
MTSRRARLPLLGAVLLAGSVLADTGPLQQQTLSLDLANRLVNATLEACHADGRTAVVAAVDRGGNLVALQRDDNIGPHNTLAAQRKAFTSLSTGSTSRALSEHARQDPESANLNTLDELLLLGGGVPLRIEGELIGALGVAGAGGSAIDEGCALTAINSVIPQ